MPKAPDTGNHIPVRNSHARRNNSQEDDPGAATRKEKQIDGWKDTYPGKAGKFEPAGGY